MSYKAYGPLKGGLNRTYKTYRTNKFCKATKKTMIKATIKGAETLKRDIKRETRRARYALNLAVRVEGFQMMRLLKKEIRDQAPGGQRFAPLSRIAARRMHRGRNQPLRRLALGVRYHVPNWDPVEMHVGWTGPRVSKRWKILARKLQSGFVTRVTPGIRRYLARYGAEMRNKSDKKYFFLRHDTRLLKTPARPIIDPFWRSHEREARVNIAKNFRRKMRGERI